MKQPAAKLTDIQKDALYSEAKKLMAVGSIGTYERAVSLLSQLRGWKDADRLATLCFRKIMVLQAQSRQKRRKFAKLFLLPLVCVLIFAFLLFKFVFPEIRYASSASQESVGSSGGFLSGTSGYSSELLENGGSADGKSSGDTGRSAMVSGDFDTDEYSPDAVSGTSHSDQSGAQNDVGNVHHRTESVSVSGGNFSADSESTASSGGASSSAQKGDIGKPAGSETQSAENAVVGETSEGKNSSKGDTHDYSGDNIRNSSANDPGSEYTQDSSVKEQENAKKPMMNKDAIFVSVSLIIILLVFFLFKKLIRPVIQYHRAVKQIRSGNYPEAIRLFSILNGYRDSTGKITFCETKIKDADYSSAIALKESGRLEDAIAALDRLGSYKDSEKHKDDCRQAIRDTDYRNALQLMEDGSFADAITAFRALDGYKNSEQMILRCKTGLEQEPIYQEACSLAGEGNREEAKRLFRSLRNFRNAEEKLRQLLDLDYAEALARKDSGDYTGAISAFENLSDYRDSAYQIECCKSSILEEKFQSAIEMKKECRYEDAIDILSTLSAHPQAKEQIESCKKLIRIPRPFALYIPAQSTGTAEHTMEDIPFLDSVGTLTIAEENGRLKSASWGADLFWKTQNVKNRGKSADKQYRKFVSYYTSLFGAPVSEYSTNGHRGSWWKSPAITVDCNANNYISIHLDEQKSDA